MCGGEAWAVGAEDLAELGRAGGWWCEGCVECL